MMYGLEKNFSAAANAKPLNRVCSNALRVNVDASVVTATEEGLKWPAEHADLPFTAS